MTFNFFLINIKKYFPRSIFSRFTLIIITPLIISQIIYIYIFFERYLNKNNYRACELLSQEINIIDNEFEREYFINANESLIVDNLKNLTTSPISFVKDYNYDVDDNLLLKNNSFFLKFRTEHYLVKVLSKLNNKNIFLVENSNKSYDLYIKKYNGFLKINVNKNRVMPVSPKLLLFWTISSSLLLIYISFIFMKNQLKSIKSLTKTMKEFSLLDKYNEFFIPKGASEIREMGQAFLKMQKEIKKYVNSRTVMLAEISHDLRTPLTRMNLEIEFINDEEIKKNIKKDIEEMQKMINEYLIFAKGESDDNTEDIVIVDFFNNILKDYERSGYKNIEIKFNITEKTIKLKKNSFKRAINNIINNSLRFAKKIYIFVELNSEKLHISLEDDGPGVSEEMYSKISQPFFKMGNNENKENVGLGLNITKNIVYKHKGKISFNKSQKLGGFCINIEIPNQ